MARKAIVSVTEAVSVEKADAIRCQVACHLGLDDCNVMLLPAGVTVTLVDVECKKPHAHEPAPAAPEPIPVAAPVTPTPKFKSHHSEK